MHACLRVCPPRAGVWDWKLKQKRGEKPCRTVCAAPRIALWNDRFQTALYNKTTIQ